MLSFKQTVRAGLPDALLVPLQRYRYRNLRSKYEELSTKDIFTKIYEEGAWNLSPRTDLKLFSGTGSHEGNLVGPYVEALQKILSSFPSKPSAVDLGCGDFAVGARVRHLCDSYIACDIVEPVISANRNRYADLDVDFRVLDITKDELPPADLVFVRQVFQHLSNNEIAGALSRMVSRYRYLLLTEHLPLGTFAPNADKPTGPDIRLGLNSGVVLTSPPFNLKVRDAKHICDVAELGGTIRTTLYKL